MNIKGTKRAVSYMLAIVVALLPITAVPVWAGDCETGHELSDFETVSYEWAADYSVATASAVCPTCSGIYAVGVDTTSTVTVSPTCSQEGNRRYSADFSASGGGVITTDVAISIDPTVHDWSQISCEWADDYSTASAVRTCTLCGATEAVETVSTASNTDAATCTEAGSTTYTAIFANGGASLGIQTTNVAIAINPTAHSWGQISCEWAADYSTVTAIKPCLNDAAHSITETVTATSEVAIAATCITEGSVTYSATFTNGDFSEQTTTVAIAPLGHNMTEHAAEAATCLAPGNSAYWSCDRCGKYFSDAEGNTEIAENSWVIPATGHSWGTPTYEWAVDYSTVTATSTCQNDANHVTSEAVSATSDTRAATCTEAGITTYTSVAFTNALFEVQTTTVAIDIIPHNLVHHDAVSATEDAEGNIEYWQCSVCGKYFRDSAGTDEITQSDTIIAALGHTHSWGTPTYTWAADYSSVTGTSICTANGEHVTTEAVSVTTGPGVAPTCESAGYYLCTSAAFTSDVFTLQTTEVAIAALGHSWGTPTYEWAADYSSVTATSICSNDAGHVTTEAVSATSDTIPSTCTVAGVTTYTSVSFANSSLFEVQTTSVALNLAAHTLVHHIAVSATEDAEGNIEYWQCSVCGKYFSDSAGTHEITQSDTIIAALGHTHSWGTPTYTWAADYSSVTATRVCAGNSSHVETETATATGAITTPATCTADGVRRYTSAAFTNTAFSAQTTDQAIAATGHNLTAHPAVAATCLAAGNSAYWTCSSCGQHFSDAAGTNAIAADSWVIPALGHDFSGTGTVTLQPTCTQAGVRTFTCARGCGATSTEAIAALGHHMVEHAAVAATCGNAGNSAYWYCDRCGKYFSDASGNNEIAANSWVIAATGAHTLVHQAAVTPSATAAGNIDNWECSVCHKHFSDEHGTSEITANSWILPATGGGSSGGGGGGGGGSAASGGSSTAAVPAKDGTVANSDGSTTTTTTADDGSRTAVTTAKDGSATSVTLTKDGSTGTVVTDKNGNTVSAEAAPSQKAVEQAAAAGEPVRLAVEVKASADSSKAAPIAVSLPKNVNADNPVKVEIPVENAGPSTVVVIVGEDGSEQIVKSSTITDDGAAVMLGGSATIKIVENEKVFSDVPDYEWYVKEVAWASSHELMNGGGDGRFAADDLTSHGMVTQILFNLEGATLSEAEMAELNVTDETWFIPSFTWAEKVGVAEGYSEDFDMNRAITREQLACMLFNYAQYKGYDTSVRSDISVFPDAEGTSFWAAEQLSWAVGIGLMNGIADEEGNVTLAAQGSTTRAMVAAMLERFCEKVIR